MPARSSGRSRRSAGGGLTDTAGNPIAFDTSKFKTKVLGLDVSGQTLPFVDSQGRASIKVELALPEPFNGLTGGSLTGSATLTADNENGLKLAGLHVKIENASLGIAQIKTFELVYVGDPFLLQASTDILLPSILTEVKAAFGLNGGGFDYADADVIFNPPRPLFTYVNLNHIGFHTNVFRSCAQPTNISVKVGIGLGEPGQTPPVARIEGIGGYDFPRPRATCPAGSSSTEPVTCSSSRSRPRTCSSRHSGRSPSAGSSSRRRSSSRS